ncbi:MAG: hypothetical protein WB820_15295 [Rhodoplanes sp.]
MHDPKLEKLDGDALNRDTIERRRHAGPRPRDRGERGQALPCTVSYISWTRDSGHSMRSLKQLLDGLHLAGLDRFESGLNAERLQEPHDLNANRLINAQAAKGDTAISAMVQEAALAVIPARLAVRAPIARSISSVRSID